MRYIYYEAIFHPNKDGSSHMVLLEFDNLEINYVRGWYWNYMELNDNGPCDRDRETFTLAYIKGKPDCFNIKWEKDCDFLEAIGDLFPEIL